MSFKSSWCVKKQRDARSDWQRLPTVGTPTHHAPCGPAVTGSPSWHVRRSCKFMAPANPRNATACCCLSFCLNRSCQAASHLRWAIWWTTNSTNLMAMDAKRRMRLAGTESARRFLLHVLPTFIKRMRRYGVLASDRTVDWLHITDVLNGFPLLGAPGRMLARAPGSGAAVTTGSRIAGLQQRAGTASEVGLRGASNRARPCGCSARLCHRRPYRFTRSIPTMPPQIPSSGHNLIKQVRRNFRTLCHHRPPLHSSNPRWSSDGWQPGQMTTLMCRWRNWMGICHRYNAHPCPRPGF